jgi:hypothetical protein
MMRKKTTFPRVVSRQAPKSPGVRACKYFGSEEFMITRNEDIKELIVEIPEGHKHVRTTIVFQDDTEWILQEATIANLVRAYITLKTHPIMTRVRLEGQRLVRAKEGYAEWQLLEGVPKGEEEN